MQRRRAPFDRVAELYDRARPSYPPQLIDDLASMIPAGGRVLEIGPGTGQATLPLAERGFAIVAIELGAALAGIARRNLAAYPRVEIVTADFEEWEPIDAGFDAIVSFTAFHWIDPDLKYEKCARLLRAGGLLAIAGNTNILVEGGDPIWLEMQEDYDAVVPSPDNRPPPYEDEVGDLRAEVEATGLFTGVEVKRYRWAAEYSAAELSDVLRTYSPNIEQDPATIERLLGRIAARIGDRRVLQHYLAMLTLARTIVAPRGEKLV